MKGKDNCGNTTCRCCNHEQQLAASPFLTVFPGYQAWGTVYAEYAGTRQEALSRSQNSNGRCFVLSRRNYKRLEKLQKKFFGLVVVDTRGSGDSFDASNNEIYGHWLKFCKAHSVRKQCC